ncbi:helicase C-terminal domain-containing protein [Crepidotus variabilis]|uniref:ATP-dependent DNA helicase CHL1 n=1 Tax=Crepidotus variabilis TaxID=179855 RepID=A0A9P6ETD1_9AGAR|nr:helicase C-terminal domain-containing protein [Crepidotus variabilis]
MNLHLHTPTDFPLFPYDPPYEIQTQLMRHLYESIEARKVTIVESPTGTGKTLSLLCASLTWLSDERERGKKGKMEVAGGDVEAKDWVIEQTLARMRREMEADEREYEEKLAKARRREEMLRRAAKARVVKRQKVVSEMNQTLSNEENDDRFLPETEEGETADGEMHISPALRALMAKVEMGHIPGSRYGQDEEEFNCTKIYYASRTHSQLSQILPELSRLKIKHREISVMDYHPPTIPAKRSIYDDERDTSESIPSTRTVSLGSRKQLCINDNLRAKARDLDEACRELLGEKDEKRCPHLPTTAEEEKLLDFRDQILASPKDIEDLASAGRLFNTCPYFGSRRAIPQAQLVTLPYNLLLQKSAREALGINLKDQIVLIDEAHNLIPTLLSLSTVNLSSTVLILSFHQVCVYVARFKTRLSAINMLHLKRLVIFLDALKKYLAEWQASRKSSSGNDKTEVMTPGELIGRLGKKVGGINLLEIESYLKTSKVARKIASYADKQAEKDTDPSTKKEIRKGMVPPLHVVEDFMLALMNTNDDGRVTLSLVSRPGQEDTIAIRYQLLNPSPHFMEIVEEARSVVLAGGTMSPISDVVNQLFDYLPVERVTHFSCDHIIPEENLQALVVSKGPGGSELVFKAENQTDPTIISQLGQLLLNFANMVPAGLIVFFPSYRFLNGAKDMWTKSGMMDKFNVKKKVFFEPEESSEVDKVLQEYAAAARKPQEGKKGALLFAVIGAKLSEGLNFADDLARGVVIIGLPFANLGSPELRERLKYVKRLEELQQATGKPSTKDKGQKDAAAELYENMCMNAVNQSIGRAIRHRGDWASLLLVDKRYATTSIRNKLPKWIGRKLVVAETFGQTVKEMGSFFRGRRPVPPL